MKFVLSVLAVVLTPAVAGFSFNLMSADVAAVAVTLAALAPGLWILDVIETGDAPAGVERVKYYQ